MSRTTAIAQVIGDRILCTVKIPSGKSVVISGTLDSENPSVEGYEQLRTNQALIGNAWAYALQTALRVSLPIEEEQKVAAKMAKAHQGITVWIAEYIEDLTEELRTGWCSSCITHSEHRRVKRPIGVLPTWLCVTCGSPTVPCGIPKCDNMASKNFKIGQDRKYCAEHRHDIPSFVRADHSIDSLTDYKEFMTYDKPNFGRITKIVGVGTLGALLFWPLAIIAAPAIGGAAGVLVGGYSGAAATSFGLAWIGGGAIATGGLGMAGGTMIVTALGTALGGGISASIANSYVQQDKSFHFEMLKGGIGVPVVVCSGFLTESGTGWTEWKRIITTRYPDSPVYRVHWGAKELRDIGFVSRDGVVKGSLTLIAQRLAAQANKIAAMKLGPWTPLLALTSIAKNPWHLAKSRADKTGVILADVLARTTDGPFVLVGHSLGARVMTVAAQTLGTKHDTPKIEAVQLLGNAAGAKISWEPMAKSASGKIFNYFSRNDKVLKIIYPVAQGGQSAAGYTGFDLPERASGKIQNFDESERVRGHSEYQQIVVLR